MTKKDMFSDCEEFIAQELECTPSAFQSVPDPTAINYYKLYKRRIVYYVGSIDESLIEVSKMIHIANIEDFGKPIDERIPIKIFIFSMGGLDQPTWNFVDMIKASKTPVWTINAGMCMSNGLSILVSGHKRFALKHSSAMYHNGSASIAGTKDQVDNAQKWIRSQDKMYEKWFAELVNIDPKLFNRKKNSDWYLSAEEMLEYGMIDQIITSVEEVI